MYYRGFLLSIVFFCLFVFDVVAASINIGGIRVNKKCKSLREVRDDHVIRQSLDFSCGPAGLATILNYYLDDPTSEKEIIRELMKTCDLAKVQQRRGFSLLDLKEYAQSKGYNVVGYQMDLQFLKDLDRPVLVPIQFKNFRHFVVVRAVVGDRVFFADPAIGNMSMKAYKFNSIWQGGIGLVIESGEKMFRDPFQGPMDYPLRLSEKDIRVADTGRVIRNAQESVIRTAIFPSEF